VRRHGECRREQHHSGGRARSGSVFCCVLPPQRNWLTPHRAARPPWPRKLRF
jgi:hypothetical protein